tara:strand:- start:59 stop:214 length:156 start_codon:yes stop_codon:yes gene_type:complete
MDLLPSEGLNFELQSKKTFFEPIVFKENIREKNKKNNLFIIDVFLFFGNSF